MLEYLSAKKVRERFGIHRSTLFKWEQDVMLQAARTPGGQRRYAVSAIEAALGIRGGKKSAEGTRCLIYCRVSTHKQAEAGNLQRQKERLCAAAVERGYQIEQVYAEVASGLNEVRRELARLLRDVAAGPPAVLLVEFKDRLARFGYRYLVDHLAHLGVRVAVLEDEDKEPQQELVEDMIAIVTSFSARLYGKRGGRVRQRVLAVLAEEGGGAGENHDPGPAAGSSASGSG